MKTPDSARRWFVVQTKSNREGKAAHHLERQGFQIYLPRYLKRRSHARKIETVAAPLFPGYMFVAIEMATQRWRAIQSTIGVLRLVKNGDHPAAVPNEIVAGMRAQEDEKGLIKFSRPPQFCRGEKIRVLAGAFTDAIGLFDGLADRERVAILLDLLGRQVRVNLDESFIIAA
jgi:transcriptional antiterminator RfaH